MMQPDRRRAGAMRGRGENAGAIAADGARAAR